MSVISPISLLDRFVDVRSLVSMAFKRAIAMAKFATAADALTAQLAVIDARLRNIDVGSDPEAYLELSNKRAIIQQAIGVTLSGDITIDNVGVTSSVLPTGASTSALQSATQAAAGSNSSAATGVQGVDGGKAITVSPAKATTTTSTNVASSATSVSLLAANSDRKFASFRNDSTAIAYIEFGATATTSSTYRLDPQGFLSLDNYTGAISCIWASANGFMRVSEGV